MTESIFETQSHIKTWRFQATNPKPVPIVQIHKQTPLQPKELEILANCRDINLACRQLKLKNRPSIPVEIVLAYETLKNPGDLAAWGQDIKNRALHRLAVEANRSNFILKQSSQWGSQYSQVVNFYLVAQPQYRRRECIQLLKPLFHPDLFQAVLNWDPQLELGITERLQLRQALLATEQKSALEITKPRVKNHYNLVPLNWVALLELWVCVPQLQHKNQLLDLLGHQPLNPSELFETPNDIT